MKLNKDILVKGNHVKITKTGETVEVYNGVYDPNEDNTGKEFEGRDITYSLLKNVLGFEDQYSRNKSGALDSKSIMSIESDGKYYTVSIDIGNFGGYTMTIELYGEILCEARVEYLHQVQNLVANLIGKTI